MGCFSSDGMICRRTYAVDNEYIISFPTAFGNGERANEKPQQEFLLRFWGL